MALRDAWLHAPVGRLSAWQQARALALREVSRELHAARGSSGASRLRSEPTGSSRLSAASRLVRAKRAGCFALARRGERSQRTGSSWLSAASEASRLVRMAQRSERSERAGSGWLSSASGASRRVGAGSARSGAGWFELAQRGAKRAGWFGLAQRGERSEPTASSWLSAASEARGLDRAGSARRAGRADWLRSPSSTAMMPSAKIACPPQSGFVSEVFALRRDQTRVERHLPSRG